jgi:hypothetical protein
MRAAAFVAAAIAAALSAGAHAQDQANPLSIKLGAYWPSDSDWKDIGEMWLYGELDYGFSRNYDQNYAWHVQLGYTERSGTMTVGGEDLDAHATIVPVTLGIRYDQPAVDAAAGYWYFGWGVGAYIVNWDLDTYSSSGVEFGGCLYGGYEWGNNFFIEGKYRFTSDFGSDSVTLSGNGLVAMVGAKLVR